MTVTNAGHQSASFEPANSLKILIGDMAFDAEDFGLGYGGNIQPTLTRWRDCYFELPKALLKDSFLIRFEGGLLTNERNVQVAIAFPTPEPTQLPTPTPTKEQLAEWERQAEVYWENQRIEKAKEAKKAHELFLKQEAVREANGDFSQAPGLTPEQKEAAEVNGRRKTLPKGLL